MYKRCKLENEEEQGALDYEENGRRWWRSVSTPTGGSMRIREENVEGDYFDALPNEMIDKVFSYLGFQDKLKIRQVCKRFHTVVDRKLQFSFLLTNASLEVFKEMDSDRPIEELLVQDLSSDVGVVSRSRSKIGKNINHLRFLSTKGYSVEVKERCCMYCGCLDCEENTVEIEAVLERLPGTQANNVVSLLRLNSNIGQLTLGARAFENMRLANYSLFPLQMDKLTQLNIHFGDPMEDIMIHDNHSISIKPYQQLLENNFPCLESFVYDNKACAKPVELLLSIYAFICRHKGLRNIQINSERTYKYKTDLKSVKKLETKLREIKKEISGIQPTQLFLRTASIIPSELQELKEFETNFVAIQNNLRKVTVSFIDSEMSKMLDFVKTCSDLKCLRIDSGICHFAECSFDCALIHNCKNLRFLDLDVDNREWSWYSYEREESKIHNLHLLPPTIVELRIEGYLSISKCVTMFSTLKKLKKFISTGFGRCRTNIDLVKCFLKHSTASVLILDNDRCGDIERFSRALMEQYDGIKTSDTWGGFVFHINRDVFDTKAYRSTV